MAISTYYAIQCTDYSGTRFYNLNDKIQLYTEETVAENKACEIGVGDTYYLVQVISYKILDFDKDYVDIDKS